MDDEEKKRGIEERREARRARGPIDLVRRHWIPQALKEMFATRVVNGEHAAIIEAVEWIESIEAKPSEKRTKADEENRIWLKSLLHTPFDGPPQG